MSLVSNSGYASTLNQLNQTVAAATQWIGTFEEVDDYSSVTAVGLVPTDAATLYIDFSSNGSDVVTTETIALTAGVAKTEHHSIPLKYCRLRLLNGGTQQNCQVYGQFHHSVKEATVIHTGSGMEVTQATAADLNAKVDLGSVGGTAIALGQDAMAGSLSVAIASDQSAVAISAAALPLPTGAATEASLASIDGKVTACNTGAVVVSGSALPTGAATEASLASIDGKVTACNTGAVVVSGSALPTGAATEASLASIDGKITACNTGAVVVSGSALPTGAATEASLASIDGKVTACNTGAVVVASSALPTGAAAATQLPASLGQKTKAAALAVTLASDEDEVNVNVANIGGAALAFGQAAKTGSIPVTLASDEDEVNVNVANIGGAALAFGQAAKVGSIPVTLASDEDTVNIQSGGVIAATIYNGSQPATGGSASVDIGAALQGNVEIIGVSSGSSDSSVITLETSCDNSTWFTTSDTFTLNNTTPKRILVSGLGARYVRLSNGSQPSTDNFTVKLTAR